MQLSDNKKKILLPVLAVICFAAASFVCLIWTRVLNHLLLSAAKDKYAFYRLKREDDDDE